MPSKNTLSKELKGLGNDLSKALKKMLKSQEFKTLEKEVATGIRSIAKSIGGSLKVAKKSKSAARIKRRLSRVVKAGKSEGKKEAIKAQAAASRSIRKVRASLKKLGR